MRELEWKLREGSLYYVRQGRGIEITRYQGLAGQVIIPETLPWEEEGKEEGGAESLPVKQIGKKAFLSRKYLRSVLMPASVENVGDYAFAYCDGLREVRFGGRDVHFGKAVFMECRSLRGIYFPKKAGEDRDMEGAAALLAAAVTRMDSPYLLDAGEAGNKEWLEKWDARMLAILGTADDEGYSKQILCGEEDYESADLETFLSNSRKRKVRLMLLRLLWPMGLKEDGKDALKRYLTERTKGGMTEETWEVVRDEYGDRREYYELFASIGCLTKENAPAVIAQTREDDPEMKAFFLKYQAEHFGVAAADFFDDLEL